MILLSRFYNPYADKSACDVYIGLLKSIWLNRDVIIVEESD